MKVIACLAAMLLLIAASAPADAKMQHRKHKRPVGHAKLVKPPKAVVDTQSDYYERDVNKLPFGTSVWWDQMLRENRLTCCN